ncbi:glycine zipper family protein [Chryseobacterium caseinilyticum]|uniref:Glycine zipper family protein n=1 Tax=Chryseobacterium caseinilyticum TaxID=2771428 RepID=A0ABR8ZCN0_9FLAO|nr:glycine zipper family protein [Chryseobacterium caseinilyticum]MBD8083057.1 glycine zipper family protein [Chryseobacterium caseinilyticum]
MSSAFEKWFNEDNKTKGNNDIVLLLEDLKFYNEKAPNDVTDYAKARIKISSFLKRNDKYYFIDRFDNVIVDINSNAKSANNLATVVSDAVTQFIKYSYSGVVTAGYIPENELENYNAYLSKNNKSLNEPLKDGVYLHFKSFFDQTPSGQHNLVKNKEGEVKRITNEQDLKIPMSEVFCYVNNGVAYRFTIGGFKEIKKNENGQYIESSRAQIYEDKGNSGMMIGAMTGGMVGALVGAAIDSGSNKGAAKGSGIRTTTVTNVYIDPITGAYRFTE